MEVLYISSLKYNEKASLERLFQMRGGYVLDFTNDSFKDFIRDSTGREIYAEEYSYKGNSKAKRLRAFWDREPDHVVGSLISDLLKYYQISDNSTQNVALLEEGMKIRDRLLKSSSISALEALEGGEEDFEVIVKEIRASIENNQPEAGLDRLHTYTIKLIRHLLLKRGITTDKHKPLQNVFKEYVNLLENEGVFESKMEMQILKKNISTLNTFNEVRNNQSLAHDNKLLSRRASLFIYKDICNLIDYIKSIESQANDT